MYQLACRGTERRGTVHGGTECDSQGRAGQRSCEAWIADDQVEQPWQPMTEREDDASDAADGRTGPGLIDTRKRGVWLLQNPSTNQSTAFDRTQRSELRVRGLLPHRVTTLEQ